MTDADNESHILHTFLGMLIHICKITHGRQEIGERYCVNSKFKKDAIRGLSVSDSCGCAQTDDF